MAPRCQVDYSFFALSVPILNFIICFVFQLGWQFPRFEWNKDRTRSPKHTEQSIPPEACFLQASVFRIAFYWSFMALLLFQFIAKSILGVILWIFAHCVVVFSNLPLWFFIWVSCLFLLYWIFLPMDFWLVLRLNYLFLACFSNSLACFCKITWHHCKFQ